MNVSQLDFSRDVVYGLLANAPVEDGTSPGPSGHRPYFRRMAEHVPERANKQGRCRHCKKNTTMMCKTCDQLLHVACFSDYHNKSV